MYHPYFPLSPTLPFFLLPWWGFRQQFLKFVNQRVLISTGVLPVEKFTHCFIKKQLPRCVLGTGINGKKQRANVLRCFQITGRIAEHQDVVFGIPVFRRYREMFRFRSHLLSGNQRDISSQFRVHPIRV